MSEGFDMDIYVPEYSELSVPIKDIIKTAVIHEGFSVPKQEILLLLKLGAFSNRKESIKGGKDSIDLLGLIFYADIDFKILSRFISRYGLEAYSRLLLNVLDGFDLSMIKYLNLDMNKFAKLKKKYKQDILEIL